MCRRGRGDRVYTLDMMPYQSGDLPTRVHHVVATARRSIASPGEHQRRTAPVAVAKQTSPRHHDSGALMLRCVLVSGVYATNNMLRMAGWWGRNRQSAGIGNERGGNRNSERADAELRSPLRPRSRRNKQNDRVGESAGARRELMGRPLEGQG